MGWSKLQFIESAFEEIGLAGYVFDLSPEQIDLARRRLDSMLAIWDADGIRIGWKFVADPDDGSVDTEMEVPLYAQQAIISSLAVRLAPTVGKTVSPDTKKAAKDGYDTLSARCIPVPRSQYPRRLPLGAGNRRRTTGRTNEFFIETETVPPSEANILEDNA